MLEFAHDTAALVTFDRKADRPTCGRLPVNGACYPVTVPGSMKQQTARRASKSHQPQICGFPDPRPAASNKCPVRRGE